MKTSYIVSIIFGILILIIDIRFLSETLWFIPLLVTAITISWGQYWIDFFMNDFHQKELESRFPDFVRTLVSEIKAGMPASQAIITASNSDYGALSSYVKKLSNQVEWNIPVYKALHFFAESTKNKIIIRAISTVIEAEIAGGNIEDVLETITASVIRIKKYKMERKAAIQGQIIQTYVIFAVFIVVMVVIQNFLIPYISSTAMTPVGLDSLEYGAVSTNSNADSFDSFTTSTTDFLVLMDPIKIKFDDPFIFIQTFAGWALSLYGVFIMLSLIQGFFTGIVVGKMSEGDLTSGLKHSLILMTLAFFVISFAQSFL